MRGVAWRQSIFWALLLEAPGRGTPCASTTAGSSYNVIALGAYTKVNVGHLTPVCVCLRTYARCGEWVVIAELSGASPRASIPSAPPSAKAKGRRSVPSVFPRRSSSLPRSGDDGKPRRLPGSRERQRGKCRGAAGARGPTRTRARPAPATASARWSLPPASGARVPCPRMGAEKTWPRLGRRDEGRGRVSSRSLRRYRAERECGGCASQRCAMDARADIGAPMRRSFARVWVRRDVGVCFLFRILIAGDRWQARRRKTSRKPSARQSVAMGGRASVRLHCDLRFVASLASRFSPAFLNTSGSLANARGFARAPPFAFEVVERVGRERERLEAPQPPNVAQWQASSPLGNKSVIWICRRFLI